MTAGSSGGTVSVTPSASTYALGTSVTLELRRVPFTASAVGRVMPPARGQPSPLTCWLLAALRVRDLLPGILLLHQRVQIAQPPQGDERSCPQLDRAKRLE